MIDNRCLYRHGNPIDGSFSPAAGLVPGVAAGAMRAGIAVVLPPTAPARIIHRHQVKADLAHSVTGRAGRLSIVVAIDPSTKQVAAWSTSPGGGV